MFVASSPSCTVSCISCPAFIYVWFMFSFTFSGYSASQYRIGSLSFMLFRSYANFSPSVIACVFSSSVVIFPSVLATMLEPLNSFDVSVVAYEFFVSIFA